MIDAAILNAMDGLIVGGAALVAFIAGSVPFLAGRGRTVPAALGEREQEREQRTQQAVESADSVAQKAAETGSGALQGTQAPTGGIPS